MKQIVLSQETGDIYALDAMGKLYVAVWKNSEPAEWRHLPMGMKGWRPAAEMARAHLEDGKPF